MDERRRFPRRKFESQVQLKAINYSEDNLIRNSFCRNISLTGVSITSLDFYPVKARVCLKVFSRACVSLLEAIGSIVWIKQLPFQKKYIIGVEFVSRGEGMDRKIKELMRR